MVRPGDGHPAALVLAHPARAGAEGCARLQALLIARAAAWACRTAPTAAFISFGPDDAPSGDAGLIPAGMTVLEPGEGDAERWLEEASGQVLGRRPGPLLVVGTDVPVLDETHARAALEDLAHGADACFGPTSGGACYLVALDRPRPGLVAGRALVEGEGGALTHSLAAAARVGLRLGLLRSERALHTPADADALVADPLAPRDIVAALRGPARGSGR